MSILRTWSTVKRHSSPELWVVTCHMGSHTVTCQALSQSADTSELVNTPRQSIAITPARKAGTRFTYAGGMEG